MSKYDPNVYPNLYALDIKVENMLKSPEAQDWDLDRVEEEICKIHPIYWMEEYGHIKAGHMEGGSEEVGIIKFEPNTVQLQISDKICKHLLSSPWTRVQIIILKHRKAGISTLIALFDYWFMKTVKNLSAFLIADLGSHTDNISAMVELAHQRDTLNPPNKVAMARSKKGFKLDNGSMAELDSGENSNPGTSGTIIVCHMSENSKWRDPLNAETSLLNSIPRKGFVFIVKESTAWGLNKFSEDWDLAEGGESSWEPIFLTWKDDSTCDLPLEIDEQLYMTEEEQELVRVYGLSEGNIKFRRHKIGELGSEQRFKQDFPLNSREPFLITGSNYFDAAKTQDRLNEIKFFHAWKNKGWDYVMDKFPEIIEKLKYHPRGLKEALNIFEVNNMVPQLAHLSGSKGRVTYVVDKKAKVEDGALTIFRPPVRNTRYVVTIDVAEGIKSSEYVSDNSIIQVIDAYRKEQVAEWGGCFDEEMTAVYAVMIARLYNMAQIIPEMNNKCGGMLQANLDGLNYRNIFYRQKVSGQQMKREYGWKTTVGNKKEVCGQFKQDFKNNDCVVHSVDLLEEMLFFIDSNGRLGASSGHTDDRIMSMCIGMKVISSTPELRRPEKSKGKKEADLQIAPEYREGVSSQRSRQKQTALNKYM